MLPLLPEHVSFQSQLGPLTVSKACAVSAQLHMIHSFKVCSSNCARVNARMDGWMINGWQSIYCTLQTTPSAALLVGTMLVFVGMLVVVELVCWPEVALPTPPIKACLQSWVVL